MKAYSYRRLSDPKQSKGDGMRRQTEGAARKAQQQGWAFDESLSLADSGVSAFHGKNSATGALSAFLRAIREGSVKPGDVLIVESLDRLSRQDIDDAFDLFRGILKTGVRIQTLDPDRLYDRDSLKQITGILEPLVIMARANEESQTKSMRGKAVWSQRRMNAKARPMTATCPKWLKKVGGKFVPIPERVAVVRQVYSLALAGHGAERIVKILNASVPPFGNRPFWHSDYVRDMLRSRTVLGEMQPRTRAGTKRTEAGQPVLDYYPAVVELQTFLQVQAVLNTRSGARGRKGSEVGNLFSGIVWDAQDGLKCRIKDNGRSKYLVSCGALRGQTGSVCCGLDYYQFEEAFLAFVSEVQLDQSAPASDSPLQAEKAQLADTEGRLQKLKKALLSGGDSETLVDVVRQLEGSKKAAILRIATLEAEATVRPEMEMGELRQLATAYKTAVAEGNRGEVRSRLSGKIRQQVREIWLRTEGNKNERSAYVQVFFRDRSIRTFRIVRGEGRQGVWSPLPLENDLRYWRFSPEAE